MKIKVNDLVGNSLNWAVAKCEGFKCAITADGPRYEIRGPHGGWEWYQPSIDWTQGGPIIERTGIVWVWEGDLCDPNSRTYYAKWPGIDKEFEGLTPLIAAMRCFVASKLGNEVDIPDSLVI
jgi:hypothetical protein